MRLALPLGMCVVIKVVRFAIPAVLALERQLTLFHSLASLAFICCLDVCTFTLQSTLEMHCRHLRLGHTHTHTVLLTQDRLPEALQPSSGAQLVLWRRAGACCLVMTLREAYSAQLDGNLWPRVTGNETYSIMIA